jgi:general secretion pathway protein I
MIGKISKYKFNSNETLGFTLLEVMVSLAILAVGLVAVMQLFSSSLRNAKISQDYTNAVFAARQKLEEILVENKDFDKYEDSGEFEDLPGYSWFITSELYEPEETSSDMRYSLQPSEEDGQEPISDTYVVTMTVTWKPSGQKGKSFVISTLKLVPRQIEEKTQS